MPANNKSIPTDGAAPESSGANDASGMVVPRATVAAIAVAAATLHRRLADALPADHMPAEATDVALARDIAERLAVIAST